MLKARVAGALGGRAAEQVVYGSAKVSSGASGDLESVERMRRNMVTKLGMSDVGSFVLDDGDFRGPNYSEDMAKKVDAAIKGLSDEGYTHALRLCIEHRAC